MTTKLNAQMEDALDSAMQASQDFQRGLMRVALVGANKTRLYKLGNALDGMRRCLEELEEEIDKQPA